MTRKRKEVSHLSRFGPFLLMKIGVFGGYLQSQAELPEKAREPRPLAITISREVNAGGRTVAELLGLRLTAAEKTPAPSPWVVFDANLAKQVLEDHKLPQPRAVHDRGRSTPPSRGDRGRSPGASSIGLDAGPHTTQTILRLAGLGHTILVGAEATSSPPPPERISRAVGGAACDANWACRQVLPPE
jgi:hypothetical protein